MCHGVFDLVHPGHIRHLLYAKEKADILVASLTADAHITKAQYRPFVPQELRALNLAALEMVDYVIIDPNPTPLDNIARIQPDFFAKGYEYADGGINPKTQQEIEVLQAYGGEILFTPGDIVYSSSHLIETEPPEHRAREAAAADGGRGPRLRSLATDHGELRGQAGARGRRHHRRQPHLHDHDRRHDQDADPERALRQPHGLYRRRRRSSPSICAPPAPRSRSRPCWATMTLKDFVLEGLADSGVKCLPDHRQDAPDDPQERLSSAATTACSRSTRSTTAASPTSRSSNSRRQIEQVQTEAVVFSDFRHGIFNRRTIPMLTEAIPDRRLPGRRQSGRQPLGQYPRIQGLRPDHAERARGPLRARRPGHRRAAACREAARRGRVQDGHSQARRPWRARPAAAERRTIRAPSSWSTASREHVVDAVGAGDALLAYATLCADGATSSKWPPRSWAPWRRPSNANATAIFRSARSELCGRIDTVEKRARFE